MPPSSEDGHYRRLLERSPAGLLVTTYEGTILDANRSAAAALGFDDPSELIGTNVRDRYLEPSERDEVMERLRREGEIRHRELEMEAKDGHTATLLISVKEEDHPEHGEDVLLTNWVDVTAQREMRERLEHLAAHDDLTGLLNRRALYDRVEQVLAMCRRQNRKGAVLNVDLTGFREVNEKVGHQGGDEVLAAVGQRLKETARDSDLVARVGGDEFVLVATLLRGEGDATQVGRRLMYAFEEPFEGAGVPLRLQPAIGVAVFPDDGTDLDALLHRADEALWGPDRKKAPGVRRYEPGLQGAEASPAWDVPRELKGALQRGDELFQVYQPVVSSDGGTTVGLESLVRWEHPEHGRLTPGSFIREAEASGLVRYLDRAVFRETIDQTARWIEDDLPLEWVAVNLSAQSLSDPDFAEWAHRVLEEYPALVPDRIVIEVTEHTAMQQVSRTETLDRLQDEVGVSISIDDFGIGYSSLLYLRRFPADFLKIDIEFVQNVVDSEADRKVVRGIIALGEAFEMELIAEGVETEEQEEWLREAGSQYLQGYRFGRPMGAQEVPGTLRA